MSEVADFSAAELRALRADFPILSVKGRDGSEIAYLDAAATSQKPQVVLDTLDDFYRSRNGAVHRGTPQLGDEATALFEEARGVLAGFLGVTDDSEIIWTSGATEALNLVAYGAGDVLPCVKETKSSIPAPNTTLTWCRGSKWPSVPGRCVVGLISSLTAPWILVIWIP